MGEVTLMERSEARHIKKPRVPFSTRIYKYKQDREIASVP
jgi:hypothetical protein